MLQSNEIENFYPVESRIAEGKNVDATLYKVRDRDLLPSFCLYNFVIYCFMFTLIYCLVTTYFVLVKVYPTRSLIFFMYT